METTLFKPHEEGRNLKGFSFIWLSSSTNASHEYTEIKQQLQISDNNLITFEDDHLCKQHIQSSSKDDRFIMIASGTLGQKIILQIDQFPQVFSIYIYCMDQSKHKQWAKHSKTIKGVFVQLDKLIAKIRLDHSDLQHRFIDEAFSIDIVSSDVHINGQSTSKLNGQFIHSQRLIDCLIRLKSNLNEMNEFISFCKKHHEEYDIKLNNELESTLREYSPDNALRYYTEATCLYRLLNQALRNVDIKLLFALRFFIRDIGTELEKNKSKSSVYVYRGQSISSDEINKLKTSVGQLVSINSFFSTSLSRKVADIYFCGKTDFNKCQTVLFEIEADAQLTNVKPYADISAKSQFEEEAEVLFMLGSIFRLIEVDLDSNKTWIVKMKLCSNNDNELKPLLEHMMNEYGSGETNLFVFGNILRCMGKLDDAERYYHRFLDEVPDNHRDIIGCYHSLGIVASEKGDCELSLEWFNKSLKINMQSALYSNNCSTAESFNSIGISYWEKRDYQQALKHFIKAVTIFKGVYGEDCLKIAMCYSNIGAVYQEEDNYSEALNYHKKALSIRRQLLPSNHLEIGQSYSCLGNIYLLLNDLDQALEHYTFALKIYDKSCSSLHPDVAVAYENIGIVYQKKGDIQSALSYFKKASKIYGHIYPDTHRYVIEVNEKIIHISAKIKTI